MKNLFIKILTALAILIFLVCIIFFYWVYSFKKSLEPKIDPALYAEIVQTRVDHSDRYSFLPTIIPQDSIKVAFFHIQGFLQGGDVIALRLTLPPKRISSLLHELKNSQRKEIASFEGISTPHAYPTYNMKKPGLDNRIEGVNEFPDDFRLFLYKTDIEAMKKYSNHGILSFTAISTSRNEVVFFIDNW